MLHAKAVIVDDLAIIGSANMDMRSLFLNYEVALFLYCDQRVEEIADWAESLMKDARVDLPSHWLGDRAGRERRPPALAPALKHNSTS